MFKRSDLLSFNAKLIAMPVTATKSLTLQEYLEYEKSSDIRHEFVDGVMVAMAGETRRHNQIAGRIYRLLIERAEELGCEVAFESVKIRTRVNRIRYPDVVVSCIPGNDEYVLENPYFIAEVLSESTEQTDFFTKLDEYKQLPSLSRYAVVSQDKRGIALYKRVNNHWEVETLTDGEIDISCLEISLSLEQIYQGLEQAS
jgi:Uma2 family endonuclease